MIDLGEVFQSFPVFGGAPLGVFGFVVLLALIGGVTSWLKVRSVQETVREAIRAGTPLDPAVIRELKGVGDEANTPNAHLTGLILIAVAIALALFGFGLRQIGGDPAVLTVFASIAAFPALIGAAFLIAARTGPRDV